MGLSSEPAAGPLTETAERYLETIYYITHEGEVVRPGRLAEWLRVSPPTVTVTLQRLARDGWLEIAADRSVGLTTAGAVAAAAIVRRHRLLERWLVDVLGLDWAAADREAALLAHGISELVVGRLDDHLGHPRTCPHGNTVPGRDEPRAALVALADLPVGAIATVARISEVAEHDAPQLLGLLHQLDIVPGRRLRVLDRDHQLTVERDGDPLVVDLNVGRSVWLEPGAVPAG
jgi:DtxR family Mn-dependent transcriptional regulator